jgi:hypothetical protein
MRDGRDGCVRATPLDCGANRSSSTDGFAPLPHAKVPDTTRAVVDYGSSLDQCRLRCLRNCSCTAYASANLTGAPGHRGCVMWTGGLEDLRVYPSFGQELYFRLAAADLGTSRLVSSTQYTCMHCMHSIYVCSFERKVTQIIYSVLPFRTKMHVVMSEK